MQFLKRVFGRPESERQAPASPQAAFDQAKTLASEINSRQVVLVRPDLSPLALACPAAGSMPEAVIKQVESIVPSSVKRNIAVVTQTGFAPAASRAEVGSPAWTAVEKDLPFFGILNGLGCIGHTVCLFDAAADMAIACRNADILIIDGEVYDRVPESSLDVARGVMRNRSIFVHDRQTFQLRPVAPKAPTGVSWAAVFDEARARTRQGEQYRIVLVRADQSLLSLPCIPHKAMTTHRLAQAHRVIPEGVARNVAVIASTELVADSSDSQSPSAVPQLRAAGRTITFFGLLLNLASAGNALWIFDGSRESVVPGCRNP